MDEAVNEVTREYLAMEQEDAAAERAAAHIDNPTLENILQALERMEVCQCWNISSPPLSLPPLNWMVDNISMCYPDITILVDWV